MTTTGQSCPRCGSSLARADVRGVGLETCSHCKGVLFAQSLLPKLLGALSVDLLKNFDPDVEILPVKDAGGTVACPRCATPMTNDNYCSAGVVFFDRCERCELLWLDCQELGAMAMMWTRMEGRRLRNRDDFEDELRSPPTPYPYRYRFGTDLGLFVAEIVFSSLLGG